MLSVEERRNKLEELLDRVKRNRGCLPEERSTADATQAEETREAIEVESIQPSVTSQPSAMVPSMEKEDSIPTVLQTHEAPIEFTPAPILKTDAEDLPPLDESEPEEIAEPELLETESEAFEAELEPIEAEPEPYEPEPEILEPEQETLEVELEPLEVELEPIEEEPVVLEPEQETLEVEPEPLEVELEPIEEEPVVLEPEQETLEVEPEPLEVELEPIEEEPVALAEPEPSPIVETTLSEKEVQSFDVMPESSGEIAVMHGQLPREWTLSAVLKRAWKLGTPQ